MPAKMKYKYRYSLMRRGKPEPYDPDYPEYCYAEPVEYADGCYIGDCWIVDKDGNRCPGYNTSPVPISASQLSKPVGIRWDTSH